MKTNLAFEPVSELIAGNLTPGISRVPAANQRETTNRKEQEPAIPPAREPQETTPNPAPQARFLFVPRPRILLADDDAGICESLGKLLFISGYDVILAVNGRHALDRALSEKIDLLVLDLKMPRLDGWETLGHLASFKPELPVIVITAQSDQRDLMGSSSARVLMEKPLDLPVFLQTVQDLLDEPKRFGNEALASNAGRFRNLPHRPSNIDFVSRFSRWGINE